ncbi:MAG: DMT family transporter [Acidocella sp.]|nr:DMT family transporter [Acidocella sp.]
MSPRLQAMLLTFFAVMLWGIAPVGTRYLLGDNHAALPGAPFAALRYGMATACFLPWLVQALRSWSRRDLLLGAFCGVLGVMGYNLPNSIGNRTVSAGMVGLLNATEPLIIVLLVSLRSRRVPGIWTFLAAVVGFAGIALLARSAGPAEGDALGITLVLFAAFNWSCYCVLIPPLLVARSALQVSAVTMTAGTLPMLLVGAPGMGHMLAMMDAPRWEISVALALGPSMIAMAAWTKGSAALGAEASGCFLYLLPVFAAGGGALVLGEPLTAVELLGGGLILFSVFISQRGPAAR